jgi:mRNA deadenylase 3'-5' endonuclease subunit Ccr4
LSQTDVKLLKPEAAPEMYQDSFSVAQFNILAGTLAAPKFFPYAEPSKLEWCAEFFSCF